MRPRFPVSHRIGRRGRAATEPDLSSFVLTSVPISRTPKGALDLADELGLEARVVEVKDCRQAQDTSPSPYGVFNIVYDGQLVTYTYIGSREKKALLRLLEEEPS